MSIKDLDFEKLMAFISIHMENLQDNHEYCIGFSSTSYWHAIVEGVKKQNANINHDELMDIPNILRELGFVIPISY